MVCPGGFGEKGLIADMVQRLSCQALWLQTATEARAAGLAFKLGGSTLLTDEERDFYRDVMFPDESRHSRICHDLARKLGTPEPISLNVFHDEREDLEKIVSMLTVERLFIRGIDRTIQFFGQWGSEFEDGFRIIEQEERPHIEHGRRVLNRLMDDPEIARSVHGFRTSAIDGFRREMVDPFVEIIHPQEKTWQERTQKS